MYVSRRRGAYSVKTLIVTPPVRVLGVSVTHIKASLPGGVGALTRYVQVQNDVRPGC